jgi:hypothetical protein
MALTVAVAAELLAVLMDIMEKILSLVTISPAEITLLGFLEVTTAEVVAGLERLLEVVQGLADLLELFGGQVELSHLL